MNTRHGAKRVGQHKGSSGAIASWMREEISVPFGTTLRVVIYARFSTDEQDESSISDQVTLCKRCFDDLGIEDIEFRVYSDEGISGEIEFRRGIDQVRELVEQRPPHVLIAEDSSRLFRNPPACARLVGRACDQGVRVIFLNDRIDTVERDWEPRLFDVQQQHTQANEYGRARIRRKLDALWVRGAAVGPLRAGYLRVATSPASEGIRAKGPFFDEVNEQWRPTVVELFRRVAADNPLWAVAAWLDSVGFPKPDRGRHCHRSWTGTTVATLIRNPVYRGLEVYRATTSRKVYSTGKRRQEPSKPGQEMTRKMPHFRIVPDHLWHDANDAIENRRTRANPPRGREHPLYGVPRDSQSALSDIFRCARCMCRMHADGRREGGYRCSAAMKGGCWNRTNPCRDLVHRRIRDSILAQLPYIESRLQELLQGARELLTNDRERRTREKALQQEKTSLDETINRLNAALVSADVAPESTLKQIAQLEQRSGDLTRELGRLLEAIPHVPTNAEVSELVADFGATVQRMDRHTGPLLKRVVRQIDAVPHMQHGTPKPVLRARFALHVWGLTPQPLAAYLQTVQGPNALKAADPIPLIVELFERSAGPRLYKEAVELSDQKLKLKEVAERLEVSKRTAHIAVQFGRSLRDAGLDDPYIEVTERPAKVARWRYRRQSAA